MYIATYICDFRYFIMVYTFVYVYSETYGNTSSDLIISSQISKGFIQLPENGTARIGFYVRYYTYVAMYYAYVYTYFSCVYIIRTYMHIRTYVYVYKLYVHICSLNK